MNRDEELYGNSFGARDKDVSDEVLLDGSASGDMSINLANLVGNESNPPQQFNNNRQTNNRLSQLASSITGIPSPNEGSQFADLPLFNDNIFHENVNSGNGNSSNNLSERHNIHFNQSNNNSLPFHTSPLVGMSSWNVGPQNLQPQLLPDILGSNIDPAQLYRGGNCCRGIHESVTGDGTSSATLPPSLIAKDCNRSQNNSKVNPVSISHRRNDQFIPNSSTAQLAKKEDLPLQELHKLPGMVKVLDENDGNVEDIFNAMREYAESAANEFGKKLLNEVETNTKRDKKKEIKNIHAKKSNKKRPARELFLRGTVHFLLDDRKTLMQEKKRQKQVIEAQRKLIEELKSRPNPTGLLEQPPSDDSDGRNSGGDSTERGPGPGELS